MFDNLHVNTPTEPVKLIGEGLYNLNVVKEIKVSTSYLGLDEKITGCRNEEPIETCTTRKYTESLLEQCGCLPFSIKEASRNVNFDFTNVCKFEIFSCYFSGENLQCRGNELY